MSISMEVSQPSQQAVQGKHWRLVMAALSTKKKDEKRPA
jgi:hypothetical protein